MRLRIEMIGIGEENTVTRQELCRMTGLGDSAMRGELQELKKKHVICSSAGRRGYFRPRLDRPKERRMAEKDFSERRRKALTILSQMEILSAALHPDGQLELWDDRV